MRRKYILSLLHAKDFKLVKVLGPYIEIIKKWNLIEESNIIRPVSKSHHGRYSASVALKQ
jgi:hypothetical protein